MKIQKHYETPRVDAACIIRMEHAVLALSTEHTSPVQDEEEDDFFGIKSKTLC